MRTPAVALAAVTVILSGRAAGAQGPPGDDLSYRLSLAATAAADASLRLHDTAAARRWLDEAPPEHRGWEWRYLQGQADRSTAAAPAHERVLDVAVSPDGRRLATSGSDGVVKVWNAATLRLERAIEAHARAASAVAFSPDGRLVASASSDGTARVWDAATGAALARMDGVSRGIAALAWRPDGAELVTTGWDRSSERGVWGTVRVWSREGVLVRALEHGEKPIVTAAFSPDGTRFYAGTWDDDVAAWDAATWGAPRRLLPPKPSANAAVQGIAVRPDGGRLAMGAKDGTLRVWDTADARLLHTLVGQAEGQAHWVNDAAWLADGRLAAAGNDLTVRLWDAEAGRPIAVWHGHTGSVTSIAASPDGRRLYTGGGDGTLRAWDLDALDPARWTWRPGAHTYGLAFSPDGTRVASTGWGGEIRVWEAATGREVARWAGHRQSGVRVAWSPDGRWLATTGNDARVVLWDAASGRRQAVLVETKGQVASVAFSPDGALVAAPAGPGEVRVLHVPAGTPRATLKDGERGVWHVAWSPDGTTLAASGVEDGATVLWDWRQARVRARLDHGRSRVVAAWQPGGAVLATGSSGRRVTLWDAATGGKLRECVGHTEAVDAVVFSPDGARLATGGSDNTLRLWDPATCAGVLTLPFASTVYELSWSPDGSRLLAAPLDGTVARLEAAAGPLAAWREPRGAWRAAGAVSLDPADPKRFRIAGDRGVLVNGDAGRTTDLLTVEEHGDVRVELEFAIPKGSNSGVYLQGRYEVQVFDSHGAAKSAYPGAECGGIYPRWTAERGEFEGHSPRVDASRPPGEWQSLDVLFRAPRFDAAGRKVRSARFERVTLNGTLIHENVEVHGPTRAARWDDERPTGPLMLQGDHGPVAYRGVRLTSLAAE